MTGEHLPDIGDSVPHPWYGDCDSSGPQGECAECAKARFESRGEWEQWLRSDMRRLFTREELQDIRGRSQALGSPACTPNAGWRRAYLALADAADHLDAMQARATFPPGMFEDLEPWKGTP